MHSETVFFVCIAHSISFDNAVLILSLYVYKQIHVQVFNMFILIVYVLSISRESISVY